MRRTQSLALANAQPAHDSAHCRAEFEAVTRAAIERARLYGGPAVLSYCPCPCLGYGPRL